MTKKQLFSAIVFSVLAFFQAGAQTPDPLIRGLHNEIGKHFFIKVYYNYIVATTGTPWITLSEAESRSEASLDYINSVYNQHDIFFVGKNGFCNNTIGKVFEYDFVGGVNIETLRTDLDGTDAVHDDGLDIYITEGNNLEGQAYHLPNSFLQVAGFRAPNIPVTETEVFVHEIGHILGLSHPHTGLAFLGNCDQKTDGCFAFMNLPCDCNGWSPGYCCGDFVDDTEINNFGGILADPITCEPLQGFPGITLNSTENFMSYVTPQTCRTKFTEGQVKRMRTYLDEAPVLAPIQANKIINNPPTNVTVWSVAQTLNSNIIVPTGQTLVINAQVDMPISSHIYGLCCMNPRRSRVIPFPFKGQAIFTAFGAAI